MSSVTKVLSIYGDFRAHRDVLTYLQGEFRRIHDSKRHEDILQSVSNPWPSDRVIEPIAVKSGGYFIYAATVIKYVNEEYFSCLERLDQVLGTPTALRDPEEMPFAELDRLYSNVLSACSKSQLSLLKRALAFLGASPKVSPIEAFLDLRPGQLDLALRAVDVDGHLYSFHASFLDFLFDPARAKDYHVDLEQCYASNFHRVFSLVARSMPALQARGMQNRLGVNCRNNLQN